MKFRPSPSRSRQARLASVNVFQVQWASAATLPGIFSATAEAYLSIEVAIVALQHDLYAFAAGVLEQADFVHYGCDRSLIHVVACHDGYIGRSSQAPRN